MIQSQQITSIKDTRVVEARALTSASGRARLHKLQLEGEESIQWALDAGLVVEHVFYASSLSARQSLAVFQTQGLPCYAVSDGIMKKISDTSYLVPVIGIAQLPLATDERTITGDLVLVLDHIQDHGNLGTIMRTASAFGVRDLVSTTPDLDIYFKKVVSASRGKVFDVALHKFATAHDAITALKNAGYQVVATSPHARDIQAMAPLQQKPLALIIGNETEGISDEVVALADVVVQIPMSGLVESLNVGVATGISLYEFKFRMILAMLIKRIRSNFGREVNVTGQMIIQAFDHALQKVTNLHAWQVILLMMLACDRQMTRNQVGHDVATFGDELDALVQPLLAAHLITFTAEDDTFHILPEGERAIAQLWTVVERSDDEMLAGFSSAEKQQFLSFLQRVQANCTAIMEH